jgi:hypothetical protein
MPFLKVEITPQMFEQLTQIALDDWRPPLWHAEWLLRDALDKAVKRAEKRRQRDAVAKVASIAANVCEVASVT